LTPCGTEGVLFAFAGSDGSLPVGGVVFDPHGNLYGTTAYGATNTNGVLFKLTY
jgi:uncharacterized repeat protein (TIGR03803 family)